MEDRPILSKGDVFTILRFDEVEEYKVQRLCRSHIVAVSGKQSWAMPYSRIKDIIEIKPAKQPSNGR
jgi:hypothetical protein